MAALFLPELNGSIETQEKRELWKAFSLEPLFSAGTSRLVGWFAGRTSVAPPIILDSCQFSMCPPRGRVQLDNIGDEPLVTIKHSFEAAFHWWSWLLLVVFLMGEENSERFLFGFSAGRWVLVKMVKTENGENDESRRRRRVGEKK